MITVNGLTKRYRKSKYIQYNNKNIKLQRVADLK